MTKVVHLSSVHQAADARILHRECQSLARLYQVSLIANHGQAETIAQVQVIPVNKSMNRAARALLTTFQVLQLALKEHGYIYHFHDPELIPVGLLLQLLGKKAIYDVHEDLPVQIMSKYWIPRYLRGLASGLAKMIEDFSSLFLSGVVAATPAIGLRFPKSKTVVIQNFPSFSDLSIANPMPYLERPQWIGYIGAISRIRGIAEIVQAAEGLPSGSMLKVAGSFSPTELENQVRAFPGWQKVDFVGWQDRAQISKLLQQLRVGLVTLHPRPNYLESYPVKMFEYMAAGVPVVASDFPLWRSIVEEAGCGLLVDPMNPQAIAQAVEHLLANPALAQKMGENGRKAVLEKFNWSSQEAKLLDFYSNLLSSTQKSPLES